MIKALPFNRQEIDKPPETAVIGKIAVVAHDKKFAFGNGDRPQVIPGLHPAGKYFRIFVDGMAVFYGFAIDNQLLVSNLDSIPRQPDHPLDEILAGVFGELEYDNIPPLRVVDGDNGLV